MTRHTIRSMIQEDLGYCCLKFFFTTYKSTALVAARLGVTTRAVKYAKADVREGREACLDKPNCMAGLKCPRRSS